MTTIFQKIRSTIPSVTKVLCVALNGVPMHSPQNFLLSVLCLSDPLQADLSSESHHNFWGETRIKTVDILNYLTKFTSPNIILTSRKNPSYLDFLCLGIFI